MMDVLVDDWFAARTTMLGDQSVTMLTTMPETVALAILRFGSRCNRAIWINSGCWNDHTLVG